MSKTKVQVAVDDGSGTIFPGTVKRLSPRAVLAVFRQDTCPPLPLERHVHLVLTSSVTQDLFAITAQVVQFTPHPPFHVVVFRFLEEHPAVQCLIGSTQVTERRQVERRQALGPHADVLLTVPPDVVPLLPSIPGAALFVDDALCVQGQLVDLSGDGAAVLVDREAEIAFVASDRVLLTLPVPGADATVCIASRIRHRQDDQGRYLYGLRFDWKATAEPEPAAAGLAKLLALLPAVAGDGTQRTPARPAVAGPSGRREG